MLGTCVTRLGVIGLSEGNGHPYSWSAICNGYDAVAMEDCGFPSIPRYLEKQQWPQDRLHDATVTHVWAQTSVQAQHIAKAALIDTVVQRPEDMIGVIDGLLIARDDAENHLRFAGPFLEAGIPVYADKAPALTVAEYDCLCARQKRPGLLFSGTALNYARELSLDASARAAVGAIRHVFGVTPKKWDRYAVHVIEPALSILNDAGATIRAQSWAQDEAAGLDVVFENGAQAHFAALGNVSAPISLRVIGEKGWRDLVFSDSFTCFRAALGEFVAGIREGSSRSDIGFLRRVVDLLERGRS
jgi:hypothetical protein